MRKLNTELISDPANILNILLYSRANGTAVGIKAPNLGCGIYVTAVDEILVEEDIITIVLKNYDISGYMLETNKLKLGEIISVCPFRSEFQNPYMKNIGQSNLCD
ncbi:MAG: hypothetical protein ABIP52_05205 [Cyclobacteriaceae bacterium]